MKAAIVLAVAISLCGCAASEPVPVAGKAIALRNADFEAAPPAHATCPEHWGCVMHADPGSYRFWLDTSHPARGARSLCIEQLTREPFATAQQSVPAAGLHGRVVRLTLAMRGEGLSGEGAGPIILATAGGAVLEIQQRIARIDGEWRRYSVEMRVPPRTEALEVGATLLGGGRVCVDDVRLEQV